MEVKLRPPFHGCLIALVTLATLGMYPLLRRMGERHFIRRMDDAGVETRSGKRIAWSELTGVTHVVGKVEGVRFSDEYVLNSEKGKVSLPLWRVENANEALEFMLRHLPPGIGAK